MAATAGVPCPWMYATLRATTVSRTVAATTRTRSIVPLSAGASAPSDQVSTCPAIAGAVVALTYCSPCGSVSVSTTLCAVPAPAAFPYFRR